MMRQAMMVAIAGGAIALAIPAAAPAQTLIAKNDAFLLGGEQAEPMRVTGRNTGPVPVEVMAETGGKRKSIAIVAPGGRFDHIFAPREIAVIRNASATRQASVKIDLTQRLFNLSMRYQLPQK